MSKKIILSAIFLGLAIFIFVPTDFANATLLTCGGDKTEADCISAGGAVVTTGTCTSCSISGTVCPSGMTQYANWTYYTRNSCGSVLHLCDSGNCGTVCIDTTTCNTSASNWLNSSTVPSCTYYVDNYSADTLPKGSLCSSISNPCGYCTPSSAAYKATCTDTPSAGCSTGSIRCSYFKRVPRTCSSTKSNVACIGSGVTPVSAVIQGKHVLMPNNQEDASIQTVSVSGGASSALNPYGISVLAGATYTVSISPRAGYSVGYTLCIDSTSCHTLTPTPGNTATVVIPSGKLNNTTPHYADLWWHYTPDPTLDFSLSSVATVLSATIIKNSSANFYWTPVNATSCVANTVSSGAGSWSGPMAFDSVMHSMSVTPTEIGTKTYTLECFNGIVSSGIKTIILDVIYDATFCTDPSCGSDCGVTKKNYCQDLSGNITPDSYCGGGTGCTDVVCDSCQWKETAP